MVTRQLSWCGRSDVEPTVVLSPSAGRSARRLSRAGLCDGPRLDGGGAPALPDARHDRPPDPGDRVPALTEALHEADALLSRQQSAPGYDDLREGRRDVCGTNLRAHRPNPLWFLTLDLGDDSQAMKHVVTQPMRAIRELS